MVTGRPQATVPWKLAVATFPVFSSCKHLRHISPFDKSGYFGGLQFHDLLPILECARQLQASGPLFVLFPLPVEILHILCSSIQIFPLMWGMAHSFRVTIINCSSFSSWVPARGAWRIFIWEAKRIWVIVHICSAHMWYNGRKERTYWGRLYLPEMATLVFPVSSVLAKLATWPSRDGVYFLSPCTRAMLCDCLDSDSGTQLPYCEEDKQLRGGATRGCSSPSPMLVPANSQHPPPGTWMRALQMTPLFSLPATTPSVLILLHLLSTV